MSDTLKSALRYGEQCKRLVNARLENANEQITAALFDEITRLRAELADCRALLAVYGDRAEELRDRKQLGGAAETKRRQTGMAISCCEGWIKGYKFNVGAKSTDISAYCGAPTQPQLKKSKPRAEA